MNLEDITMAQVLACMTEEERKLLDALVDTGGVLPTRAVASMLGKQVRREASLLMNGGSGA